MSLSSFFFFSVPVFLFIHTQLLVFWFVEAVSQTTLATVMSVKMASHENSSTTLIRWTLSTKATNFAIFIHLIVLQHSQLNLLSLMLILLGSGVGLLLPLLSTTTKSQHKMKGGLLLDVVVRQSTAIFQLLTSKDQPLLVRRNSFLILDLGLYIFYSVRGFNLERDRFPRKGLHENLHLGGGSTTDGGSEKLSLSSQLQPLCINNPALPLVQFLLGLSNSRLP